MAKIEFLAQSDFKILQGKARLLDWFRINKRNLPFRANKDPYLVWISEVMLQQTRMNTVLPLYEKFVKKFPNIRALAKAREEDVLISWSGLGYYSRALNLKKGAEFVMRNYQGIMPSGLEDLLKIPGIGPYTARAISSIAFGKLYAVLDGNVKRVIARIFLFNQPIQSPESTKKLQEFSDLFLNQDFPGDHNEAMMELGATICGRNPDCKICPLIEICMARKKRREKFIPVKGKEKEKISIDLHFLLLKNRGKILLIKDRKRRFLKTIFAPPYLILGENLPPGYENHKIISEIFQTREKKIFHSIQKHSITHHDITLRVSVFIFDDILEIGEFESKWVKQDSLDLEFHSSIAGKLLKIIST